ncbi:MAG: hypothetical protein KDD56_05410 [Bdellovibrionales bacterium]|nr:hypothetical protein [Bdellovibrionales bacterium]
MSFKITDKSSFDSIQSRQVNDVFSLAEFPALNRRRFMLSTFAGLLLVIAEKPLRTELFMQESSDLAYAGTGVLIETQDFQSLFRVPIDKRGNPNWKKATICKADKEGKSNGQDSKKSQVPTRMPKGSADLAHIEGVVLAAGEKPTQSVVLEYDVGLNFSDDKGRFSSELKPFDFPVQFDAAREVRVFSTNSVQPNPVPGLSPYVGNRAVALSVNSNQEIDRLCSLEWFNATGRSLVHSFLSARHSAGFSEVAEAKVPLMFEFETYGGMISSGVQGMPDESHHSRSVDLYMKAPSYILAGVKDFNESLEKAVKSVSDERESEKLAKSKLEVNSEFGAVEEVYSFRVVRQETEQVKRMKYLVSVRFFVVKGSAGDELGVQILLIENTSKERSNFHPYKSMISGLEPGSSINWNFEKLAKPEKVNRSTWHNKFNTVDAGQLSGFAYFEPLSFTDSNGEVNVQDLQIFDEDGKGLGTKSHDSAKAQKLYAGVDAAGHTTDSVRTHFSLEIDKFGNLIPREDGVFIPGKGRMKLSKEKFLAALEIEVLRLEVLGKKDEASGLREGLLAAIDTISYLSRASLNRGVLNAVEHGKSTLKIPKDLEFLFAGSARHQPPIINPAED